MSLQGQPGAEGSLSESVHFPPTSSFLDYQGGYQMDGRVAMAPPLSSSSRAPVRPPVLHDDLRGGPPHYGGYDRPEYDYALRRHSCSDHLGLHSGNLIEQLLLQENQKALRMASMVQSQASGCLSGCLSCGSRSRFRDSEERILDEQRCYSRNAVGEGPSRPANLDANAFEYSEGWIRQPNPRQSTGERSQSRIAFSDDELGRSLCQGRRISYPVCHPTVSHSQASHHVEDHHLHSVGAADTSVPILGFGDADGRVRQRWPMQRQSYSDIGTEEDGWQRPSRSRGGPASTREQDRLSLPGIATGSLPRTVVGSPHRAAGDSVRPSPSTRTSSQSLLAMPENSTEPSYQDNAVEQTSTLRLVTQGPISLTNWYIMKVQIGEGGRVLETKVAVGGWLFQNREHVKTSPIVSRLDIHKVVTEDGVEVFLEGAMDQETSNASGFSPGIVQCLSAGFPYMWKQLLRLKPVGEASCLAVSESLGGLHPKASKCLSEDESQGVNDPKISKTLREDVPCSSRDCEGTSPTPTVNEDWLTIQNPVNTASDLVETEATLTSGAEKSHVEPQGAVSARTETLNVVEAVASGSAVSPRAEMSNIVEAVATGTAVSPRAEMSNVVEAVATGTAVSPSAEMSIVVEAEAAGTAVSPRAETSNVVEAEAAGTARSGASDVLTEVAGPARNETSDVVVTDAAVTAGADTSGVVETDAAIPVGARSSDVIDECRPHHELPQQSCDVDPNSLDPAPATEAPFGHVTDDFLAKESENGPVSDTTCVTIRRSRKSMKESSKPVRSSTRLQQRQSRSSTIATNLLDSQPPTQVEQVTSGMNIAIGTSAEEEPAEFVPDVEQATAGREELTKANSIIEEVLMDLRKANTEAVNQDPMETSTNPQPMEVEVLGQPRDLCEYLSKDSDGFEIHKSKAQKVPLEDVLAGVEIEAAVSSEAFADLENEEMEETTSVSPPNLEIEQTVPLAPPELGGEGSGPATPSEMLQSKFQPRADSLSEPSSRQEQMFPETNARMTRSLKRRLKMSLTTDVDVFPVPESLKRLRRRSDPVSNPETSLQEERANVESVSNPDTPLQEEVDAFHVRVRDPNSATGVCCSNCKQPCSRQDLLNYSHNAASPVVTPEQVPKEERVDYAPLSALQHSEEGHEDRTETCSTKRGLGRFKNMKPATRFAKTGTSRRLIIGESHTAPTKGNESRKGKRPRKGIVFWKGRGSRKGKGSRRGKGSSEGCSKGKGSSEGEGSTRVKRSREGKGEGCSKGKGFRQGEGSSKGKGSSEGEGSMRSREGKGSREVEASSEGFGLESSRGKNRRNSILPPPLPPPRVQDKSKVPEAFGLKTSRSGRLLVPPLAFWRSQSIEYDKDGGIIAIFDGFQANPADTGCFNFTPPQEKHAKRIQEKLCKAATAVTKRK